MKAVRYTFFTSSVVSTIVALPISFANSAVDSTAPHAPKASAPATQPAASVQIDSFSFHPRELEISVGTTVTWKNDDDVPHTATSKGREPLFDSAALDTDDKFSFTFSKPGRYTYYCKVHPHMTGVVIVK
jgi:plastocyanin